MKSDERKYQEKIQNRVYSVNDYLMILKDVMNDIISQTHHFDDKDLKYVRNKFVSMTKKLNLENDDYNEKTGFDDYWRDIHTIGTEVVQLNRFGSILYEDDIDETKKIDDDFFDDEREDLRTDREYKKYKSI
tara:strand:- start:2207 stop:2602 length:396 start_codon:yes stop_codon:yes gene_type:complete